MSSALDEALSLLLRARTPSDLFGTDGDEATRTYRRLARLLHPDATGGRNGDEFTRLNALWRGYNHSDPITITTRRHSYRLSTKRARGDLADLYRASYDGTRDVIIKLPRDPADGDLLEREAVALRQLPKDGDGRFLPYVPRLLESFRHRDAATGVERRANAINTLDGFYSLAEVHAAYPDGLDPRDAAWMWRRLLVALGLAHGAGVLHGAVVDDHVLIEPAEHGLVLVDWCYVTGPGEPVRALVPRYADRYPPEVSARLAAGPGTDIAMAARAMAALMGDRAPAPLLAFAHGCATGDLRDRPDDAWRLLGELDALLERLYGPRRFRVFTM
jgi:hypothetical protein